ncbi:MAG: hypothetical protein ACK55Z_11465 [bacterium]
MQYTLKFIPLLKACQMMSVFTSLYLCRGENFFAILVQNFLMMLDLASETALRTALTAIFYLMASVRVNQSLYIVGMGYAADSFRFRRL